MSDLDRLRALRAKIDTHREYYIEQEAKARHDQRPYHGPNWAGIGGHLSQQQKQMIDQIIERLKKEAHIWETGTKTT